MVSRALNNVPVSWEYDALGRLTEETNPLGTFGYGYDGPTGRLASATYPNGQTTAYSYFGNTDDRRLQTIHHKTPGATTLSKFDYTYDVVGNIGTWQQQADAAAPTLWSYGYDAVDQLVSAAKTATNPQAELARYKYGYDAGGNRTEEQVGDVVTGATFDAVNHLVAHSPSGALAITGQLNEAAAVTIDGVAADVDGSHRFSGTKTLAAGSNSFTVAATDGSGNTQAKTFQVDAAGLSRTFSYDANGNLTSDGTRTFEWDAEDRLVTVTADTHRSEFTYDGLSRRTRIVEKENGATVRDASLFWAGTAIVEERVTTGEINRFFANGELHDGTARYVTRDHLGSIREVTDSAGAVVTRNDYDPYGRLTRVVGTEDSRFGYTGHMVHGPSGLSLAVYRAYDAQLGRWISSDPIGLAGGINLHEYAASNPLYYVDRDGLNPLVGVWPGVGIGGAIGGLPGAVVGGIVGGIIGAIVGGAIVDAIDGAIEQRRNNPLTGVPGSESQTDIQTRRYGPDGYPETDTDTGHDHNGAGNPHSHDWKRPGDGKPPTHKDRGPARPWKPGDPNPPGQCRL